MKKTDLKRHGTTLVRSVSVVAIFGLAGIFALHTSHAATYAAASEAESGTVSGNASMVSDGVASGGGAVKFGASGATGGEQSTNCISSPHLCGFPDATNTGVPAGTTLTASGNITVTTNGAVIDAMNVNGSIIVQANNVTIKRTRVTSGDYYPIRLYDGYSGLIVEDSEVAGNDCDEAIFDSNYTALRDNIHGCEDGLEMDGNVTIQDSYIHDLYLTSSSHNDGIQNGSGSNMTVQHNTIIWPDQETSCVNLTTDFGAINNVAIDDNLLDGGAYTLYSRIGSGTKNSAPTNVSITNNHFGRDYVYGIFSSDGPVQWSGNVWDNTGAAVSEP